ncbi:MAG: methyltransferase [Fuerstiella sp.]|nr:methyltransferase [Fuerstiella sp.]MCP4853659.1 methyltransferase [Fuerstiella sp.]
MSKSRNRRRPPSGGASRPDKDKPRRSPPRGAAERLILEHSDQILPRNALLVLLKGTAVATHLTQRCPNVGWKIFTFEHLFLTSLVDSLSEVDAVGDHDADIELFCMPDLPDGEFDTVILPTDSRASSELTRDVLQAIAARLKPHGRLIVSTNNARDHWLHKHLQATFGRITVFKDKQGICYIARQRESTAKAKDFRCEFAFRANMTGPDEISEVSEMSSVSSTASESSITAPEGTARLIRCVSRPGVFSHRKIDAGARALIRSLSLLNGQKSKKSKKSRPPERIVEMGCGCGAVATATALEYPNAEVLAVDSHARAVQSTEATASLNEANNVSVLLTADGNIPNAGTWDLFLCNPPYYSDFRISEFFLQSAVQALTFGGKIHLVTKLTDWHQNRMIEIFANATVYRFGEYDVIVSMLR